MEEKYRFEDWYSGAVNLDTEPLFNISKKTFIEDEKSPEKDESPKVVSLNSFSVDDQKRIIDAKTKSFTTKVQFHYNLFFDSFLKDFEKSLYKIEFINKTINEINSILKPSQVLISDRRYLFWNVRFEKENLIKIKEFADLYLLKGKPLDFLFEHSENSKYNLKKDTITNEVYAYSLYKIKKEILKLKREYLKRNIDYLDNLPTKEIKNEPKNLHTNIFVNGYGSDLFDKLFNIIVDEEKPFPSISFIFYALKKVQVIKDKVSHYDFILFINEIKGVEIAQKKLVNRTPKKFKLILENLIESEFKDVFEYKESRF